LLIVETDKKAILKVRSCKVEKLRGCVCFLRMFHAELTDCSLDGLNTFLLHAETVRPPKLDAVRTVFVELGVQRVDDCRARFTVPETFFHTRVYLARKLVEQAKDLCVVLLLRQRHHDRLPRLASHRCLVLDYLDLFLAGYPEWVRQHRPGRAQVALAEAGTAPPTQDDPDQGPDPHRHHPSQILPWLWQGGQHDRPGPGVDAVLSACADEYACSDTRLDLPIRDGHEYPITPWLQEATNFMDACEKREKKLFVHCSAGINRSSTLVLAFLIRFYGMSLDEAWDLLREARARASPLSTRFLELHDWEFLVHGRRRTLSLPRAEWS
jgi:hypothetical protein